jgi:nucleotide-binding universal stress UspA family protein
MTTDAIFVATDGSDHATCTVERAVELAHDCGATLHAIRVVDVRALDSAPHRERMEAAARDSFEAVERRATEADLPVVTVVRDGIPHEEILECRRWRPNCGRPASASTRTTSSGCSPLVCCPAATS